MKNGASTLSSLQRPPERGHDGEGEIDQAGVHHGGVLALEKADAPDLVRQRQPDARHLFGDDGRGALLHLGGHRREHRADRRRCDVLLLELAGHVAHADLVERRDLAPVELIAAAQHVAMAADGGRQIVRPIGQRRQRPRRRKTEADRRHRNQTPPLDDGVGEVRGADHHRPDVGSGNFGFAQADRAARG